MDLLLPIVIAAVVVVAFVTVWAVRRRKSLPPTSREALTREASHRAASAPDAAAHRKTAASETAGAAKTGDPRVSSAAAGGATETAASAASAETEEPDVDEDEADAAEPADAAGKPGDRDVSVVRKGLANTRGGFVARLAKLFSRKQDIDTALLDDIEEVLITADIGVRTASKILDDLRGRMERGELTSYEQIWSTLRSEAASILEPDQPGLRIDGQNPSVVLVVGVNGVGKTTTIGKLASRFQGEGRKVVLAAGDTFRAAAVSQLEVWGRRVGCPVVKGKEQADPGSVIFDAIKQAQDESYDLVIADTAGRLHTKTPLMEELKKVHRTTTKALGGREPDEVLLVLDATTGQNAVQQAQLFREALDITGLIITKLDGTAKGGAILGIVDEHRIPVRFIGLGERVEDLREFDPDTFVEALFANPEEESIAA